MTSGCCISEFRRWTHRLLDVLLSSYRLLLPLRRLPCTTHQIIFVPWTTSLGVVGIYFLVCHLLDHINDERETPDRIHMCDWVVGRNFSLASSERMHTACVRASVTNLCFVTIGCRFWSLASVVCVLVWCVSVQDFLCMRAQDGMQLVSNNDDGQLNTSGAYFVRLLWTCTINISNEGRGTNNQIQTQLVIWSTSSSVSISIRSQDSPLKEQQEKRWIRIKISLN